MMSFPEGNQLMQVYLEKDQRTIGVVQDVFSGTGS